MVKKYKNIIVRRLVRSYITSATSISLLLFLVALAAVFAANASSVADYFKENMSVSVILKQTAQESEAKLLAEQLSLKKYIKESTYISRERGEQEMKTLLGEDFLDVFESSPIPLSIEIHLDGEMVTEDSLAVISRMIQENEIVEEVVYQESLVEALNTSLKEVGSILAVVALLLMTISFALVNNTVRLNIYARRFTIHTMSLVGAKRSFIARPFVVHAIIQGGLAGVLASCGTLLVLMWADKGSGLMSMMLDKRIVISVLVAVLVFGIVFCVLSTLLVVNKVAYISKDDLYY